MTITAVTQVLENIVALAKDTLHDIQEKELIMDKVDVAYLATCKLSLDDLIKTQKSNIMHHPHVTKALVGPVDYSIALRWAKQGFRIARAGWNGKGMWVIGEGLDTPTPFLTMRTVAGEMQKGWLPSQSDNFAEDWTVLYSKDYDLPESTYTND